MKFKFYYTFYLFCLFTTQLFAQTDYRKTYYPLINKAELAILDKNYQEALTFYDQAFAQNKPFAKDIHNAALCGMKLENKTIAKKYLMKFAKKGLELRVIEDNDNFFVLKTDKDWQSFKDLYQQFYEPAREMFDIPLIDSLKVFQLEVTKVFVGGRGEYFNFGRNGVLRANLSDTSNIQRKLKEMEIKRDSVNTSVHKILIKQARFCNNVLKERGFVGEDEIGILDFEGNTMFTFQLEEFNFRRFQNFKNESVELLEESVKKQIFVNAVANGKISPWKAYKALDNLDIKTFERIYISVENQEGCSPDNLAKLNKWLTGTKKLTEKEKLDYSQSQLDYGIESLADLKKKDQYRMSNKLGFIFERQDIGEEMTGMPNCEILAKKLEGYDWKEE